MNVFSLLKWLNGPKDPRTKEIRQLVQRVQDAGEGLDYTTQIRLMITRFKEFAADGLTFEEATQIIQEFSAFAVQLLKDFAKPGEDKKQIVLESVMQLFTILKPFIPMPWWLFWLPLDSIALTVASGAIELAYRYLVLDVPAPLPAPAMEPVSFPVNPVSTGNPETPPTTPPAAL